MAYTRQQTGGYWELTAVEQPKPDGSGTSGMTMRFKTQSEAETAAKNLMADTTRYNVTIKNVPISTVAYKRTT
jgi:hypothetical protein